MRNIFIELANSSKFLLKKCFELKLNIVGICTQIMKIYRSELKKYPFPRSRESIRSLASIKGSESGYNYAEVFKLVLVRNSLDKKSY
jgi:hypothetical protein